MFMISSASPLRNSPRLAKNRQRPTSVGDKDGLAGNNKELSRILAQYDIRNVFELYDGYHSNRIAEHVETKVLPFFSRNLSFVPAEQAGQKD